MNRNTFEILCTKGTYNFKSTYQCRATSGCYYPTNVEYRTISNLFGLGLSTVAGIVVETCKAIADNLLEKCVCSKW